MVRHNWFRRRRDGSITVELRPDEAALLLQIIGELRGAFEQPADSPILQRMFPRAYLDPTEDAAEAEYSALANAALLRSRLDRTQALLEVLEPVARGERSRALELSEDDIPNWMGTLNDVRLAMGVAFNVDEDTEPEALDDEDPRKFALEVYSLISWFFGELVDVVAVGMPIEGLE